MDTGTGRISSIADSIPLPRRLSLSDDEHKTLRPLSRSARLAWLAEHHRDLAAAGRLPEQQGRPKWPKQGRSRARRAAQSNRKER